MSIDYSKWDRLEVSSSDDEDDDHDTNDHGTTKPRVTRLDAPSKVTFGGGSSSVTASPSVRVSNRSSASSTSTDTTKQQAKPPKDIVSPHQGLIATVPETTTTTCEDGKQRGAPPTWTERGGLVVVAAAVAPPDDQHQDQHRHRNLYWAQDRYSVTLRLELQEDEKVESVDARGILPYTDRFAAVGSTKPKLSIYGRARTKSSTKGAALLEGELPHHVHLAEDDDDVDWNVEAAAWKNHSTKYLTVTLQKAAPMHGVSLWWRRPLMEFPEVDLDIVKGGDSQSSNNASKDFLNAWEQAHKMFREGKQKPSTEP